MNTFCDFCGHSMPFFKNGMVMYETKKAKVMDEVFEVRCDVCGNLLFANVSPFEVIAK